MCVQLMTHDDSLLTQWIIDVRTWLMRGLLASAVTVVPSDDARDWKAASVGANTVATVEPSLAGVANGEA